MVPQKLLGQWSLLSSFLWGFFVSYKGNIISSAREISLLKNVRERKLFLFVSLFFIPYVEKCQQTQNLDPFEKKIKEAQFFQNGEKNQASETHLRNSAHF